MSRAVIYESFGGPEVLTVAEVPEPHAGPGEVRVRIGVVGLNPMDWKIAQSPQAAARFGITLPSGFGSDYAGTIDEVGEGVDGWTVGDRVYGGALGRAAADFVVLPAAGSAFLQLRRTPDGIDDEVAAALPTPGLTAAAVVSAIGLSAGDTVLIGGAAGGVGVLTVQLVRLAGARVIGTASPDTFGFLQQLGAEPVAYGAGLVESVRALVPGGLSAAIDLHGTQTAEAALALGVDPSRISTIAAGPNPPGGVRATGGFEAAPTDLDAIVASILAGSVVVPIAARFPLEEIRDAVSLQAAGHAHGKVVVTL